MGQQHPVLELIRWRQASGSRPGHRQDPHRLGLAIEGGGLRGVVTAGMITGLELLGLRDAFDVVYGASAGASNGAYFVAGQGGYGTTIYYDWLTERRFIDLRWAARRRPIVNLPYLFQRVMTTDVVLDWEAVAGSPVPLKVLATSVSDCRTEMLADFRSRDDLLGALHASASIPLLGEFAPYSYRGGRYWDAGLLDTYGIRTALADGCSHVLVLRSRPRGGPMQELNRYELGLIVPYIARFNPKLARLVRQRNHPGENGGELLLRSEADPSRPPFLTDVVTGPGTGDLPRLDARRASLVPGAIAGAQAVLETFGHRDGAIVETLAAFDRRGRRIGPGLPCRDGRGGEG